jgi:uncharacterized membrane protein YeaQ/YmgE (transglycosylase-associated protein family)
MLARLILLALQLAIAWFAGPKIVGYIPSFSGLQLFVYGAVFAVVVWVVGLILSQVLRETPTPSSSTLVTSLVVALIGAAVIKWLPTLVADAGRLLPRIDDRLYPLIGAVLGYQIRR